MNNRPHIYFCADDYGMSEQTCDRIEECCRHGSLNRISVFPNSTVSDLEQRLKKLDLAVGIHLNLVEGSALCPPEQIPLLANPDGSFRHSFEGLFLLGLTKPGELSRQVYLELDAQILRMRRLLGEKAPLILDSHQHTHMIPCVFRTLLQVLTDRQLSADMIRIPAEPLRPFLLTPSVYLRCAPINLVKQAVLKVCRVFNAPAMKKAAVRYPLFMGIALSGNMEFEKVSRLLPHYIALAEKQGRDVEVLFHPGYTDPGRSIFNVTNTKFLSFYRSEGRRKEYEALMHLKKDHLPEKDEVEEHVLH